MASEQINTNRISRFFIGYGIAAWLVVTIALRFVGQYILTADGGAERTLLIGVLLTPPLALLIYPAYRWKKLNAAQQQLAAICFAVPGQILDAFSTLFFTNFFPNMSPAGANHFGALMLWGYSVIILTGFVRLPNRYLKGAALIILTVLAAVSPVYSQTSDEKAERRERATSCIGFIRRENILFVPNRWRKRRQRRRYKQRFAALDNQVFIASGTIRAMEKRANILTTPEK